MAWKSKTTRGKNGVKITRTQRTTGPTRITTGIGNKTVRHTSTTDGNKNIYKTYTNINGWRTVKTKTVNAGANWKVKRGIKSPKAKTRKLTRKQKKNELAIIKWMFYIIVVGYIIKMLS